MSGSRSEPGLDIGPNGEPIPIPTPVAQPFFDAAAEGRLRLQKCPRKGFFFYPRNRCPCCLAEDWSWEDMSPEGLVVSYTIDHRGMVPGFSDQVPYGMGFFELADGVRMPGRVRADLDRLAVGAKVKAVPVKRGPVFLFEFELV